MSIEQKVIALAEKNLQAIGAQYRIICQDGQVLTNIVEEQRNRRPRVQTVPMGTYIKIYEPILKDMESGDFRVIQIPNDFNAEFFRASACGYMSKRWGPGQFNTEVVENELKVLRA